MDSEESLDIEVRFVFPRRLLNPAFDDNETAEQIMQALISQWSDEMDQGVQIHLAQVSEGLII